MAVAELIRHRTASTRQTLGASVAGLACGYAIERALGYGASALELGFGFLQYFIHPSKQTVHDRIAETIVIQDGKSK